MIYFSFLKLIFFIAILFFFGWQFTRRVLKQNELYLLIPVSLFFGIFGYTFFLNLTGYLIPIRTAFWLSLFLLFVLSLFLFTKHGGKIITGVSKRLLISLILISIFSGFFFGMIYFSRAAYDETWHGPLISTILHGNFPVMKIEVPDSYAQYHYAFDLFAAGTSFITGLNTLLASDFSRLLIIIFIFWLSYSIIYKITRNGIMGMFASWLIFFGGGFRYFSVLKYLDWHQSFFSFNLLKQIINLYVSQPSFTGGYFQGYSVNPFGVFMYHRPLLFSVPIILLFLWLAYMELRRSDILIYKITLGIMLGFLALTAETSFVILAIAWGVWRLLIFLIKKTNQKNFFLSIIIVGFIAVSIAIFQGGIITDAVIHRDQKVFMAEYSQFELRMIPTLTSYDEFFPLNKTHSWIFLIMEWGIPLILLPIILYLVYKSKNKYLQFIVIIMIISFSVGLFVNYSERPGEMFRVNYFTYFLLAILTGILFGHIWNKFYNGKKIVIFMLLLSAISPLIFNIKMIPREFKPRQMKLEDIDMEKERIIAQKANELLPLKASVVTATPLIVTQLWGNKVFYGSKAHDDRSISKALPVLLEMNNVGYIKSRGVDYIYLNPTFINVGGKDLINSNMNKLELIYEQGEDYKLFKIR